MTMKTVRLELARSKENPHGRDDTGYELRVPLSDDGHLDHAGWQARRKDCTVRRFEDGVEVETGRLVHRGSGWYLHYDGEDAEDDEPVYKLDRHRFVEGEYVSITEHDGKLRTFRVASVR